MYERREIGTDPRGTMWSIKRRPYESRRDFGGEEDVMRPEVKRYRAALDESMARFRERAAGLLGPYSGEGLLVDMIEALVMSQTAHRALAYLDSGPNVRELLRQEREYRRELAEGIAELRTYLADHDLVLEEHDPGASALYA